MTIEANTVTSILSAGSDSVTLINSINTDASSEERVEGMTQAEINEVVQRNVDHLEIILAYTDPDVAGSSEDKTSYTDAISTGKSYIENNS